MKSATKKFVSFILAFSFAISLFAVMPVETKAITSYDGVYEYTSSSSPYINVLITGYNGKGGAITIPNNIDNRPVVGIETQAFLNCTNITSVTIQNNIEDIGDIPFDGCSNLTQINVTSGNKYFKSVNGVLFSKDGKTLIQYPMGKSGTSYTVPSGVTLIDIGAFTGSSKLTKITLPESLTSIGEYAFSNCSNLTTITLPESLETIRDYAFFNCGSLTSITIPAGVNYIGPAPFNFCTRLTQINVNSGNSDYIGVNGVLISLARVLVQYPNGKKNLSYTIPDNVDTIGYNAFEGSVYLQEVTINRNISNIQFEAFSNCISLEAFSVSEENATYMSADGILFNKEGTAIRQYPAGKTDIKYTVPDSVTEIGAYAFSGFTNLLAINLSKNLIHIRTYAFSECAISYINIPGSVRIIDEYAFFNCESLIRATFEGNAPEYCEFGAFYGCKSNFAVYYQPGYTGWQSPLWGVYPSYEYNPDILAGTDRYDTAVQISKKNCDTADTALLALGTNFPDALSGGSLAYQLDAPILLSKKDSLPAVTKSELARLGVSKVIVLGGEPAISAAVVTELQSMGITVERISGSNRYATAVAVAGSVRSYSGVLDTAVLASGENFPDALSMGSYAAKSGIPILLTQKASLSADTAAALVNFGITKVIVAGGTPAVSQAVLDTLDSMGITVTVVSGSDRYSTGTAAAGLYFNAAESAIVACGTNFPDALAAVPYAAKINAPILLVKPTGLPDSVRAFVTGSVITNFVYAGGDPAVGPAVRTALEGLI